MKRKSRLIVVLAALMALSLGTVFASAPLRVFAAGGGVEGNSTISPTTPQTAVADGVASIVITFNVKNATPANEPGDTLTFTPGSLPAGVTAVYNPASKVTDANGNVVVTFTSVQPASFTLGGSDSTSSFPFDQTVNISFTPAPPSSGNSTVGAAPGSVAADGLATSLITVTLHNTADQAMQGKVISLTPVPSTGVTVVEQNTGTGTTNAQGVATFLVKSTAVANVTFNAVDTTDANFAIGNTSVNFTQAPVNAGQSTVQADQSNVAADNTAFATVTVTVKDAGGHAITNPPTSHTVSLSANAPAGVTITGSGVTDASGQAAFTVKSSQSHTADVFSAIVDGATTITQTVSINFTVPPASKANSTVSASPSTLQADGVAFSLITVTLNDAGGNPTSGKLVTLAAVPNTGVVITAAAAGSDTTGGGGNAAGVATFKVTSTNATNVVVTATDSPDGITLDLAGQQKTLTFQPATPSNATSTITRSPVSGTIAADGVTQLHVIVTLKDAGGHIVPGKSVTLQDSTHAALPAGYTVVGGATQVDSNNDGIFDFVVTAVFSDQGTPSHTITFSATDTTDSFPLTAQVGATFVVPPANNGNSTVVATDHNVLADNTATTTVTVTVEDAGTHPLQGKSITLIATPNTGVTITPNSVSTAANGTAVFTVKSSHVANVTFTAQDTTDGLPVFTSSDAVDFGTPPADAGHSTISATPASGVLANSGTTPAGKSTISIHLGDVGGNALSGKVVFIHSSDPGVVFVTSATQGTDASGNASFVVGSDREQTATFNVDDQSDGPSHNNFLTTTVGFVAVTSGATHANSTLTADNLNPTVGDTVTIKATLHDANGTAVKGVIVSFSTVPSPLPAGTTLSAPTCTTLLDGSCTVTLQSTNTGDFTINATDGADGIIVGSGVLIHFNPSSAVSASQSTVVVSNNPAPADGASMITVTVTVKNGSGTPLAGSTVTLSSSRGGTDTIAGPAPATTGVNGQAVFTVKSSTAGQATLTAVADGVTLTTKPLITFNPLGSTVDPNPPHSTVTISPAFPSNQEPADGSAFFTITVTLRTSADVPVDGKTVTLTTTRGSGVDTISPASELTGSGGNPSGVATFTLKSNTAGSGTVSATGDGLLLAQTVDYTFNPVASPVSASNSTVVLSPTSQAADGSSVITATVTLKNGSNVGVSGKTVTLTSSRGAVDTISPASQISSGTGVAVFTIKSSTPGGGTVTAVGDGVTISQQPLFTFTAVSPILTLTKAGPASFNIGTAANYTIQVRNTGSGPTSGAVTVTDVLPTGFSVNTASGNNGFGTCGTSGTNPVTVTCTTSTALAVNVPATITINVTADDTATNPSLNNATASGGGAPDATSNTVSSAVGHNPNLSLLKFDDGGGFYNQNDTGTFIIEVSNEASAGPTVGTTTITDTLPNGTSYVSSSALVGTWSCSRVGQVVTCTTSDVIDAGTDSGVLITARFNSQGTFSNQATVTNGTVTAHDNDLYIVGAPNNGSISASNSTISPTTATIPADNTTTTTFTVTIRDGNGLPITGAVVNISPNLITNGSIIATSSTTDFNGQIQYTVKSGTNQTVTFTATATYLGTTITVPGSSIVNFGTGSSGSGGAAAGANSTLTTNFTSIPADNIATATLTVTLKNSSGTAVSGKNVTISGTPALSGMTISPASATTDANGQSAFTVRSTTQGGPVTYTATDTSDGITVSQTVQITFTAPGTAAVPSSTTATATPTGTSALTAAQAALLAGSTGANTGIVVPYRLCVRSGPGTSYPALGVLKGRTPVSILARNAIGTAQNFPPRLDCQVGRGGATWLLIQLGDGQTGWVSAYYIRVRLSLYRTLPFVDVNAK